MRSKILSAILCFLLCLLPANLRAQEFTGPQIEESDDFHTFPIEVLQGGVLYIGVLMGKVEYQRMVKLEGDYELLETKLEIYENHDKKSDLLLDKWDDFGESIKTDLKDIRNTVSRRSFFDEYGFELGFGSAAALAITIFFLVK